MNVVVSTVSAIVTFVVGFIFALYLLADKERMGRQAKP